MISPLQRTIANRYQILSLIGAGGMSEVYEVKHLVTQELLAIKIIQQKSGSQQNSRFLREASLSQRLNSSGVVKIYDAWVEDNFSYLVMERLKGDTIRNLAQNGRITRGQALGYMVKALEVLEEAHLIDIIHRDIKPENIFICEATDKNPDESIKILDFGLSRQSTDFGLTHTGYFLGTPWYMSPEQAMSPKSCLHYTDIWSVGIMLYEILTDCVPFEGETVPVICMHIYSSPHVPVIQKNPNIPKPLSELIDQCLEKNPTNRPQSAKLLALKLSQILQEFAQIPIFTECFHSRIKANHDTQSSIQDTQDFTTVKEPVKLKQIQIPSQIVRQIQEESKLQFDTFLDLQKIDTPLDDDEFMDHQSTVPLSMDEINARLLEGSTDQLLKESFENQADDHPEPVAFDSLNLQTQIDQHNPFYQKELYGEGSIFNESVGDHRLEPSQDLEKNIPTVPMSDHVLEAVSDAQKPIKRFNTPLDALPQSQSQNQHISAYQPPQSYPLSQPSHSNPPQSYPLSQPSHSNPPQSYPLSQPSHSNPPQSYPLSQAQGYIHQPQPQLNPHALNSPSQQAAVVIPQSPQFQETWLNEDINTDVTAQQEQEQDISVVEELPKSTLFTWFLTVVLFFTSMWIWLGDHILKLIVNLF